MNPVPVRPAIELLRRIQGEFLEMPGLRLTEPQARRLWNLDPRSCSTVLSALIEDGFLFKTRDGSFMHAQADVAMPTFIVAPRAKTSAA